MMFDQIRHRRPGVAGALGNLRTLARRAGLSRKQAIVLACVLVPVVAALIAVNIWSWRQFGEEPLDSNGHIALALGVIVTLSLGVGLMGLIFYSSRRGYDEETR
jgi:hypothetical protein